MGKPLHRSKEPEPQILVAHMRGEIMQQRFVFRTQRPQSKHSPVSQARDGLELLGIWRNGQARRAWTLGRCDAQASIEGHDTAGIGEKRVDVELANLRLIGGEL